MAPLTPDPWQMTPPSLRCRQISFFSVVEVCRPLRPPILDPLKKHDAQGREKLKFETATRESEFSSEIHAAAHEAVEDGENVQFLFAR